jgi:protease I
MTVRVAIPVADEVQDEEVFVPRGICQFLGWDVMIAGPSLDGVMPTYQQVVMGKRGTPIRPTLAWHHLRPNNYDAVIIPGGWAPERMRQSKPLLDFVRSMCSAGKVVAAICHGPLVLCSAGLCKCWDIGSQSGSTYQRARKMTCYVGMKDDLIAHGAEYVDLPVVVDGNIVTSPHYRDIPSFMRTIRNLVEKQRGAD